MVFQRDYQWSAPVNLSIEKYTYSKSQFNFLQIFLTSFSSLFCEEIEAINLYDLLKERSCI